MSHVAAVSLNAAHFFDAAGFLHPSALLHPSEFFHAATLFKHSALVLRQPVIAVSGIDFVMMSIVAYFNNSSVVHVIPIMLCINLGVHIHIADCHHDGEYSEVNHLTEEMLSLVKGLHSVHTGEAADAFINKAMGLDNDITQIKSMIQGHEKELMEIAGIFQKAETENIEMANSLPQDVI